ncbi:hypothetical protein [Chryseobacterium daeguense]|uniref:hypothetical protein n=1 Tax=Chryseobacterium daeguense TaxID=412438 RepID=UPI000420B976|nr:hypothetical protein [Chryseobacterium daeguense]
MFNFFKKKKSTEKATAATNSININSISIPNFGWNKVEDTASRIVWVNPEESALISLNFFDLQPDIPTVRNLELLKNFYRNSISESNGGLIEVSLLTVNNIPSVKTIFKVPQPESGMTYLASVTIPFENYSFVVKIQAAEVGTTGMRDSVILSQLLASGEVTFGEGIEDWFADPYDPDFKEGTPMNKSEQEKYDAEFPEHPLSIARASIVKAIQGTNFKPEIKGLAGFNK